MGMKSTIKAIPVYLAVMIFTAPVALAGGRLVSWGAPLSIPPSVAAMNMVAVSAGNQHSLALAANGSVIAWGNNDFGQSDIPANLPTIRLIAAGGMHSLAVSDTGGVLAWGRGDEGQLQVPQEASKRVVAISAGLMHNLALLNSGHIVAWGDNSFGQSDVPGALNRIRAIGAGGMHSVALRNDGLVVAWGDNSFGQLHIPGEARGAVAISAGYYHTLALTPQGRVVAWGDNFFGQCNVPENALSGVVKISAGETHSMALKADGSVVIWGGITPGLPMSASPLKLPRLQDVDAGAQHSLGIISSTLDSDGDGIPDWWEIKHGLDPFDASDAARDSDGDGVSNYEEFLADTDPNSSDSHFALRVVPVETGLGVQFGPSSVERRYTLEFTTDLASGVWHTAPQQADIRGTGSELPSIMAISASAEPDIVIYRMRIDPVVD